MLGCPNRVWFTREINLKYIKVYHRKDKRKREEPETGREVDPKQFSRNKMRRVNFFLVLRGYGTLHLLHQL